MVKQHSEERLVGEDALSSYRLTYRDPERGCLIWRGTRTPSGYGFFWNGHRKVYVHRFAYEMAYGHIPFGKQVCHRCDRRACFESTHLWLGTFTENMADMVVKGRGRRNIDIAKVGDDFAERRLVPQSPFVPDGEIPLGPDGPPGTEVRIVPVELHGQEDPLERLRRIVEVPDKSELIRRHLALGAGATSIAKTLRVPVADVQRVIQRSR